MDNLHSDPHAIADHREYAEVTFAGEISHVRPRASKAAVVPTVAGTGWYHDAAIESARGAAIEARCNPYHG